MPGIDTAREGEPSKEETAPPAAPSEPKFLDADSGYHNVKEDAFSIRVLIMEQVKKVGEAANMEPRGGYWKQTVSPAGGTMEVYVPDSRELYCAAVLHLSNLLYAELKTQKRGEKHEKPIAESIATIEKARQAIITKTKAADQEVLTLDFYKDAGDRQLVDQYKQFKMRLYQQLFIECMKFLKSLNYMQAKGWSERMLV